MHVYNVLNFIWKCIINKPVNVSGCSQILYQIILSVTKYISKHKRKAWQLQSRMSNHSRLLHRHPLNKHKWLVYSHVLIFDSLLCLFKDSWLACSHRQRGLRNTPLSRVQQVTYIHTPNSVEIRSANPRKQLCQINVRDQFMPVWGRAPRKTRQRGVPK